MKFVDKLKKMGACPTAVEWVGDKNIEQAWNECERADWMLWYLSNSKKVNRKKLVKLAAMCAETVLHLYKKQYPTDNRVRDFIRACYDYSDSKITLKELNQFYINVADAATYAAEYAAYAVAYAASNATCAGANAAAYANAASFATVAAARDASNAAYTLYAAVAAARSAKKKHHKLMCDMIRKEVKM